MKNNICKHWIFENLFSLNKTIVFKVLISKIKHTEKNIANVFMGKNNYLNLRSDYLEFCKLIFDWG